jgi:hypothetical protein
MKKIAILLLSVFASLYSFSQLQPAWYHYAEEFYFVKEVPVSKLTGKNFRYEIAVKSDPSDTLSKVRIHGIAVGKGQDDFLKSDFIVESRTEQDWTIYTIIGSVQPGAARLWFYAAVNGNGKFYFDDISFYIEEYAGHWKQLQLFNHSFEEKNADIFAGYYVSKRKSTGLQTQLTDNIVKTGQHSLFVRTSNAEPATVISTATK